MYKKEKCFANTLPSHKQHTKKKSFKEGFTLIEPKACNQSERIGREHGKLGFTLIELIVVMAVLAILVLLAAPKLLGYSEKARNTQIKNDIRVLENKIDEYLINHGALPEEWEALAPKPSGGGKKCSLLTIEKDGPVPISTSEIESFETKYPMLYEQTFNPPGLQPGEERTLAFYKTKVNNKVVLYTYIYGKSERDGDVFEDEGFMSLDDFETLFNTGGGGVPKYPIYFNLTENGVDLGAGPFIEVSNMSKDQLPKYYAKYNDDFIFEDDAYNYEYIIVNDTCFSSRDSADGELDDVPPTNGITGKLYDKTGPIDSISPGEFKLVEKSFYSESKLDANFYANNEGVVIYEDNN